MGGTKGWWVFGCRKDEGREGLAGAEGALLPSTDRTGRCPCGGTAELSAGADGPAEAGVPTETGGLAEAGDPAKAGREEVRGGVFDSAMRVICLHQLPRRRSGTATLQGLGSGDWLYGARRRPSRGEREAHHHLRSDIASSLDATKPGRHRRLQQKATAPAAVRQELLNVAPH